MLEKTHMLSMNQLAAYSTLLEMWKARTFNVPHLATILANDQDDNRTLRSDTANNLRSSVTEPFGLCAEKLWNLSSRRFRSTNLLNVAKCEARLTALQLPL